jgi:endoglucanase
MNRREFLLAAAGSVGAAVMPSIEVSASTAEDQRPRHPLRRKRGFNLLEKFFAEQSGPYREADFAWMKEWGFDFVRLPMSYLCWTDASEPLKLREKDLKEVDQAVEFGRKHGVHVNLNFHRAPGYCVNPPKEPMDLWTEEEALRACAFHWHHFAGRYKGIANAELSFDLLNEPPRIEAKTYERVVRRLVEAIRSKDPDRLVVADGLEWGRTPVPGLADLGIAQSTRGYDPMQVSHYKASWVAGADKYAEPAWPLKLESQSVWDKERLRRERIAPWKALEAKGVHVHVGEWGAFQHTPHHVVLAWMRDCLELWKEAGWGWALWNFRGSFGILDSGRSDVKYEDFRGHRLDRQMLELLRAY